MDIRDLQYGDLVLVNGTVNRVGYDLQIGRAHV